MPVARNIESVALLAPGTIAGDARFGDDKTLISFGGSSVAENAYYINGMNVTNFRNGLGGASVPFEFYSDFEIKTGGYSAEFGRSTGGVINAVTKHGTNEFHYGNVSYFSPSEFYSGQPDSYRTNGEIYDHNSKNKEGRWVSDFYVSGPIIEDTLFFYALYEMQSTERDYTERASVNIRNEETQDDDFYGLDLLWNINDYHSLNLTYFSDERTIERDLYKDYDYLSNRTGGAESSTTIESRGGENTFLRYEGHFSDALTVSLLYGENKYDLGDDNSKSGICSNILNNNPGIDLPRIAGCSGDFLVIELGEDKREAFRFDVEWAFAENHLLRFGMDNEVNSTQTENFYAGPHGQYYRYFSLAPGSSLQDGNVVPDVNGDGSNVDVVRTRYLYNNGDFETEARAFYLEDIWQVNANLELTLGVRSENFDNKNGRGETFIEINDQIAPRLGARWDFSAGEEKSILYANWGRYFLSIPNNTNARLAGFELFTETWFLFDGAIDPATDAPANIDANGLPTAQVISPVHYFDDGEIADTSTIVDANIEPMYQDEWIVGYNHQLNDMWSVGVSYINRELQSGIDDVQIEEIHEYVLTNPGTSITVRVPQEDGTLQQRTFSADELGYPEAQREYQALQVTFDRVWDGVWSLQGSYTYSESEGNTEGLVKSDNGQGDAGITTDFDFVQLTDGAFGNTPNDRPHLLKVWGNYQWFETLRLGGVFTFQSGRPINRFGLGHPDEDPSYGQTFYSFNNETGEYRFHPRGSQGRTPSITNIDFNMVYSTNLWGGDLELRLDIFNILDSEKPVQIYENSETGSPGNPNPDYRAIMYYQNPRSARLGMSVRF
ncbi:TonB-dependent receptor [Marinibactrum halimedae]|uniref:Oar protein n=1 Tax=Marinibactrum halimedae TaxID=1444977 RepID=A0AA37WR74_9GAMM|nr:TonB-dependent receptor [Marinibactrum halimedae]MCD9460956.1 TonB-dependent receptor [Marinibactrum halimedae]GLS28102.1 Oar protein [Marinibactrum halimedae]